MFADDIALMSDTVKGLQSQLNALSEFCDKYMLSVNETKTKIVVFKKGGVLARNEKWTYKNTYLEVVSSFCYVGLKFTQQISMNSMVHDLCVKGKRVMISTLNSLYGYGQLSSYTFFKLFDCKISPQLLYGSEIWGLGRFDELERVQTYACKRFLCAKQKASNVAVLGDCSRYPMYIKTYKSAIKYWLKILKMSENRIVKKCYKMMLNDDYYGHVNWVTSVKKCLQNYGFSYVWYDQDVQYENYFLRNFETRLKDTSLQEWNESLNTNSKLQLYKTFKREFIFERYIDILNLRKFRYIYVNFRIGSHDLEIEKGRYNNTIRENRICKLCDTNTVEDEYHFLLNCNYYSDLRAAYIPLKYFTQPNINKFNIIMSTKNEELIKSVAMYLYYAFERRKRYIQEL
jgi:hypothetical protein